MTLRLIVLTWGVLVASAAVALADDGQVQVPEQCSISADAMGAVHLIMCDADIACTQRIVDVVCGTGGGR